MPNTRVMLWVALAAILFLNYEAWIKDYPPESSAVAGQPSSVAPPAHTFGESLPSAAPASAAGASPSAAASPPAAVPPPADAAAGDSAAGSAATAGKVHVVTDVLDLTINLKGGELDRADLLQYPLHKDTPNVPVRLFDDAPGDSLYVLQSGLLGTPGEASPTHLAIWSAAQESYSLSAGAGDLVVPLVWTDAHGLKVTKTFTFKRGAYAIDLDYLVQNGGESARSLAPYTQILRHWVKASRSYFDVETYSFKGPSIYDGTKTEDLKVDSDTDSKFSQSITNGWIASLQHHFVSAVVPEAGRTQTIQLKVQGAEYLLSATGPMVAVAPGASTDFNEKLFVGPKLQSQLDATGPELARTVDYGRLYILAHPLFVVLTWVHGVVGNWGWAIIIVTALIKLMFYPLSQASGRSMAKMRAIGPRMKQIQDSYKDDREKLGRAMMELYKKEKINPLAGCLPMVVQIPFFISFYWVLLESVEMRQAPFMLWVNDLSSKDPYFVLPLFMGGAMFGQFKLNPAPPDPMQAKIMQFMPLVMTGMMAWFPSGLVLYWLTNTVLSIVQQWRVNQVVQSEAGKPRS
jgi:YidC/Oxa1 family membrane protein insertase